MFQAPLKNFEPLKSLNIEMDFRIITLTFLKPTYINLVHSINYFCLKGGGVCYSNHRVNHHGRCCTKTFEQK